ncbi:hypothetical protein HDV03_004355 [Kappamyces sp. JEL0829]|nr:hypothetical protein HDV03_004355 [Kappamyces sp. JEL0829]
MASHSNHRQYLQNQLEHVKHLHSSKVTEFYKAIHHDAAVLIQSRWKGFRQRQKHQTRTREASRPANPSDEPAEAPFDIPAIVQKIKERSQPSRELFTTHERLKQQCKVLDALLAKKSCRSWPRHGDDLCGRTNEWLEACLEEHAAHLPLAGSPMDPAVTPEMREAHKAALARAKQGWWKEKLQDMQWDTKDTEFDAWIMEIESGIDPGLEPLYY